MSEKKHEKRSNYNEHHAEVACWSDTFWPGHTSCLLFDLNKSSASAGLKPADLSWKHNEDNASKRYESRYKDNPKYLPKKKIPDYTSGPGIKYDAHNKLYSLDDDVTKLKTEFQTWKNWDFIPFVLHDIANKKYLPFSNR